MWDERLSKQAGRVVTVLGGIATAWACYEAFREGPMALPISELQAAFLFDGSYYPILTVVVLLLPLMLPAYGMAFAWDYVTGQGMFADQPAHSAFDAAETADRQS